MIRKDCSQTKKINNMPISVDYKDFARRIREKNDGAYADKDDRVLAEAYIKKHPSYASRVTFDNDSNELNSIVNAPDIDDDALDFPDFFSESKTSDTGNGDDYSNYIRSVSDAQDREREEAQRALQEYDQLYDIQLANIDATTRATIASLRSTFRQAVGEQERINKINIDRVRAYGLGGDSAQYLPIAWSDAVTNREREGANEIKELELERQSLIDQARAAQREGNAALLSQKIKDYNTVKDRLNKSLNDIEVRNRQRYEMLVKVRQERENEYNERKLEALQNIRAFYSLYPDNIRNLSSEDKDTLIRKLTEKYGLEYYEALASVEGAVEDDLDRLLNKAKVDKAQADAIKAYQGAVGGDTGGTYSNTDKNKLRAAGLANAPQNVKDVYLHGDGGENEAGDINSKIVRAWLEKQKSGGGDGGEVDSNDPEGLFTDEENK